MGRGKPLAEFSWWFPWRSRSIVWDQAKKRPAARRLRESLHASRGITRNGCGDTNSTMGIAQLPRRTCLIQVRSLGAQSSVLKDRDTTRPRDGCTLLGSVSPRTWIQKWAISLFFPLFLSRILDSRSKLSVRTLAQGVLGKVSMLTLLLRQVRLDNE